MTAEEGSVVAAGTRAPGSASAHERNKAIQEARARSVQ